MATPTFKAKLVGWQAMSTNLQECLEEIPYLAADQNAMDQLVEQGRSLESRQGIHLAALREVNRQRVALEKSGDELRNRLAGALRHKFGESSQRLHAFGVKPKVERRRRLPLEQKTAKLEKKRGRIETQELRLEEQRQRLEARKRRVELQIVTATGEAPPETR